MRVMISASYRSGDPSFVTTLTTPDRTFPYSALNPPVWTWTSWTEARLMLV